MARESFTVSHRTGIHLKPATAIAQKALEYEDHEITFTKDGETVDVKSVTNILGLGAAEHSQIDVEVEGPEAEAVLAEILAVVREENI